MASKIYFRTSLTGGTSGDLDSIDGAILSNGDGAIVILSGWAYFYHLNATSGEAESSPNTIKPDINANNKRWELINVKEADSLLDGREVFIQASEPSGASTGDIWIEVTS